MENELILFGDNLKEPNYMYRRTDYSEVACYAKLMKHQGFMKVKTAKSRVFCLPIDSDKLIPIKKLQNKKENKMQNSNTHSIAIALMEKNYQSAIILLPTSDTEYTYIVERSMNLKEKDKVIVPGKRYAYGNLSKIFNDVHPQISVGIVKSVSDDIDIDIDDANLRYTTVLGKLDSSSAYLFLNKVNKVENKIKKAVRRDKIESVIKKLDI